MTIPKISFACKIIQIEDIIRCSFDINKTQYETLIFLGKLDKPLTISEIASQLHKDRTTIQKAVKVLFDKQLLMRRQMNLDNGGYTYYYTVKDRKKIKKQILGLIDSWSESAKRAVKRW